MNRDSAFRQGVLISGICIMFMTGCDSPVQVGEPDREVERAACNFTSGALPGETLGKEIPQGSDIKIDHFVILMLENRSFDHYFGALPGAGHTEVDGLPVDASNPGSDGRPVAAFHSGQYCVPELPHDWNAAHQQYNDGKNDGFVLASEPGGERAMGYMDERDLPFYYGLARTFSIADRFFSSVLGPTFPNRFYFLTGTSDVRTSNRYKVFHATSIFDRLDAAGISWEIYSPGVPFATIMGKKWQPVEQFFIDAESGSLPQVVYIDPMFQSAMATDEHAPHNIQRGQQYSESIYDALRASPHWPSSALIITYDEHGGFYDHVPPPKACPPDAAKPDTGFGGVPGGFDRYGFRVPLIVVSPWSRPGYVSHVTYDLTSILRLVEARYDLPALTARDANATPITDLFDFSEPRLLEPPAMPKAVIDPSQFEQCRQLNR